VFSSLGVTDYSTPKKALAAGQVREDMAPRVGGGGVAVGADGFRPPTRVLVATLRSMTLLLGVSPAGFVGVAGVSGPSPPTPPTWLPVFCQ